MPDTLVPVPSTLDSARLRVIGELDIATTPRLERALHQALSKARSVVLDLRDLIFIESSGVHTIVDATVLAHQADRRLVVLPCPQVDRILRLTGVDDRIEIASEPTCLPAGLGGVLALDRPVDSGRQPT